MDGVREVIERLTHGDGALVDVVAPAAYEQGRDGPWWLYDPSSGPLDPAGRIRLCPNPDRPLIFVEPRVGAWDRPPVEKHTATIALRGRVRPSRTPGFAAELADLQWATFSYAANCEVSQSPVPWETRYALLGPHPRLDEGIPASRLLAMREEWLDRLVRASGFLVIPYMYGHRRRPPESPPVLVSRLEDRGTPGGRIILQRDTLPLEERFIYSGDRSLRVEGARVARCIVSGVLRPPPAGGGEVSIDTTSELCLGGASPLGEAPEFYEAFGADDRGVPAQGAGGR